MNKVSFEDIGAVTATFLQGEGVVAGQVVKVTKNGEVGPCSDGADGKGGVKTAEGGVAALVVSVDEGGKSAIICL